MHLRVKPDKLQHNRQRAEMTSYRLAKAAGLPINAIYRLEDGSTKRTSHFRARAIAEALHCEVSDIFINEKEMPA